MQASTKNTCCWSKDRNDTLSTHGQVQLNPVVWFASQLITTANIIELSEFMDDSSGRANTKWKLGSRVG